MYVSKQKYYASLVICNVLLYGLYPIMIHICEFATIANDKTRES